MNIRIIRSHSVKGLEKQVNHFLLNAWQLHGNLIVTFDSQGKPKFYIQALQKELSRQAKEQLLSVD